MYYKMKARQLAISFIGRHLLVGQGKVPLENDNYCFTIVRGISSCSESNHSRQSEIQSFEYLSCSLLSQYQKSMTSGEKQSVYQYSVKHQY